MEGTCAAPRSCRWCAMDWFSSSSSWSATPHALQSDQSVVQEATSAGQLMMDCCCCCCSCLVVCVGSLLTSDYQAQCATTGVFSVRPMLSCNVVSLTSMAVFNHTTCIITLQSAGRHRHENASIQQLDKVQVSRQSCHQDISVLSDTQCCILTAW